MKQIILVLLLFSQWTFAQPILFKKTEPVPDASFRGLSVVDDSAAWISGAKGWVGKSINGGREWKFNKVPGYEQCDFRSIYAFNATNAIIANAGAPAVILRTADGGDTWKPVYKNGDTSAFFDGIDFWDNKEGIIYGDPINGRLMVLRTTDGGLTWKEIPPSKRPVLSAGEASFAASGTCIRCMKNGKVIIATGGKVSRLLVSEDKGINWRALHTPIILGQATTGIFSCIFRNDKTGVIVGGDYKRDTLKTNHVFYTKDGGKSWLAPVIPTRGYRECVEYIGNNTAIATGPGGTDVSYDGGINWQLLSDEKGFHVVKKSRKGKTVIIAGTGKISIMSIPGK